LYITAVEIPSEHTVRILHYPENRNSDKSHWCAHSVRMWPFWTNVHHSRLMSTIPYECYHQLVLRFTFPDKCDHSILISSTFRAPTSNTNTDAKVLAAHHTTSVLSTISEQQFHSTPSLSTIPIDMVHRGGHKPLPNSILSVAASNSHSPLDEIQ
jgi:hypothetical protein